MAQTSGIEWTDGTFNPWIGCTKVSAGCKNCYAERDFDHRKGRVEWGVHGTRSMTGASYWHTPLQWNAVAMERYGRRMRVFCASLADVFEKFDGKVIDAHGAQLYTDPRTGLLWKNPADFSDLVPLTLDHIRTKLKALWRATPNIEWLVLTKRPENIVEMIGPDEVPFPNVRFGTSIEDQATTVQRVRDVVHASRWLSMLKPFISAEPLLSPVILGPWIKEIGWVITGGESGPDARVCHPECYTALRDECIQHGVPFLFKQWGEHIPVMSTDGRTMLPFGRYLVAPNGQPRFGFNRVGKKQAGRLLEGMEHNGFPID